MINIFGYEIESALFWTILGIPLALICVIIAVIWRARLRMKDQERLDLQNYEESLRLARQLNNKEGEANALANIGLIYQAKVDLDQALKYHQEALKIDKEIGFREGEASALGNIGQIYQARGDLERALKYFQDALEIHKEISDREGEAKDLGSIGMIYLAKGEPNRGMRYYLEGLKIANGIFEKVSKQIKQKENEKE